MTRSRLSRSRRPTDQVNWTSRSEERRRVRALGSARPTNQQQRATPLELFFDLASIFAATQVTAYMAYERSLHGVIPGLLLLALLWERWAGYTWLAGWLAGLGHTLDLATQRAAKHDLAG